MFTIAGVICLLKEDGCACGSLVGLSDSLVIEMPDFCMISFSISEMSDSPAFELLLLCVKRSIKLLSASLL